MKVPYLRVVEQRPIRERAASDLNNGETHLFYPGHTVLIEAGAHGNKSQALGLQL